MPLYNVPVHVECSIMRNVMASDTEAELGRLFGNYQRVTFTRTVLAEMGHQQSPTPLETDNTVANIIVNGMAKKKISQAIDIIFYWVRDRIRQNLFHIFWEEGKKNLSNYVTKHHLIWQHRIMRPRYIKTTKNI